MFRGVLGNYPTGVCIVTSVEADGTPVGMSVGSFTSISLDPPLVGFFPAASSTSWPRIRASGRFGVNVLADDQQALCARFARSDRPRFEGVGYMVSAEGLPRIDGIVAWIACDLEAVLEVGDHEIAVGRVSALDAARDRAPLLFCRGGYGAYVPRSLA